MSTKSLDGETSLKLRRCPNAIRSVFNHTVLNRVATDTSLAALDAPQAHNYVTAGYVGALPKEDSSSAQKKVRLLQKLSMTLPSIRARLLNDFRIIIQPPRASLHEADARLFLYGMESAVDINNVLLEGCILRNTKWVLGLAVYTGHNTKSQLNSHTVPKKHSQLNKAMDYSVAALLCMYLLVCIYLATRSVFWKSSIPGEVNDTNWIKFFLRYMVVLYAVVPISLYCFFHIFKALLTWGPFNAKWISWMGGQSMSSDKSMEYEGEGCAAYSAEVLEELGSRTSRSNNFSKRSFKIFKYRKVKQISGSRS